MKDIDFPIFKTKMDGSEKTFNLTDGAERQAYFEYKAGDEIKRLREYLKTNTFIVYLCTFHFFIGNQGRYIF
jgi:hypothetical protein